MKKTVMIAVVFSLAAVIVYHSNVYAGWSLDGVPVCSAPNDQTKIQAASDGVGGSIIIWLDYRNGTYSVYAQRIDIDGNILWMPDGVPISIGTLASASAPQIKADSQGGAIIAWEDVRNGPEPDIFAQRIDGAGATLWNPGGVAVRAAPGMQAYPRIAIDGLGGVVVVWKNYGTVYGNGELVAQKVNGSGILQWPSGGVTVCGLPDPRESIYNHEVTFDGTGGVIVAFHHHWIWGLADYIYVQRVNWYGSVVWPPDIVASISAADWAEIQIISDDWRGAIVVWEDDRDAGEQDIYAQRINSDGDIRWDYGGVAICAAAGHQVSPRLTSDGLAGGIVAWVDPRSGDDDIYTQRIDHTGVVQWTADGIAVCSEPSNQSEPQITGDGSSGAIITWSDPRGGNKDIYAQKISSSGLGRWGVDGEAICSAADDQDISQVVSDGTGGAIISWQDHRNSNWDVYTMRAAAGIPPLAYCEVSPTLLDFGSIYQGYLLDMDFVIVNVGDGTLIGEVSETCDEYSIVEGGGIYNLASGESLTVTVRFEPLEKGHFVCEITTGCEICETVYCTGFSLPGEWIWDGIPICTTPEIQYHANIAMVDSDKAIIAWLDNRLNESIFAQKVDISGNTFWPEDGLEIVRNPGMDPEFWNCYRPQIVADGTGGAFIIFDERTSFPDVCNVFVQLIDGDGINQWPQLSIALEGGSWTGCTRAITDGMGGAFVACCGWQEGGSDIDLYQVLGSGIRNPDNDGFRICSASNIQYNPQLVSDDDQGMIVVWQDFRNFGTTDYDIYAQRALIVGNAGFVFWADNGVPVCLDSGSQEYPQIAQDGLGGAIITWEDGRDGNYQIYAQRMDGGGNALWTAGGVPVCTVSDLPVYPWYSRHCIVSDGFGGAVVAWEDMRNSSSDIYMQRIDSTGAAVWVEDGEPVCTASGSQLNCKIIKNGYSEFIVTWQDGRGGNYDIYAQKVDTQGQMIWPENGVEVSAAYGSQGSPFMVSDNQSGALIVWEDTRSGNKDIYAQRVKEYVAPVATLLQSYSVSLDGSAVTICWVLSHIEKDSRFFILRSVNLSGKFEEMIKPVVKTQGLSFTCTDSHVETGITYSYRVEVLDGDESRILFETDPITIPKLPLSLYQNYPNPFNPHTTIKYYLPERKWVVLDIFAVSGKRIVRLLDSIRDSGMHTEIWDGKDTHGNLVASGIYFYKLRAGKMSTSRKMILLR